MKRTAVTVGLALMLLLPGTGHTLELCTRPVEEKTELATAVQRFGHTISSRLKG